jgi:hypothetical protein
MFDAVRVKKASQQIVSRIRKQVFGGKLALGDKLPPEKRSDGAVLRQQADSKGGPQGVGIS